MMVLLTSQGMRRQLCFQTRGWIGSNRYNIRPLDQAVVFSS